MIVVGVDDNVCASKCFNFQTGQEIHSFANTGESCTTIDYSLENGLIFRGDSFGNVSFTESRFARASND